MNIFVRSFDMLSLQSTLFVHERLLHTFLRRKYFVICASVISLLCGPRRAFHTDGLPQFSWSPEAGRREEISDIRQAGALSPLGITDWFPWYPLLRP